MRSLGADFLIDYQTQDFTQTEHRYDLILDMVAKRSSRKYYRTLNPSGAFVMVGGSMKHLFQLMLMGPFYTWISSKRLGILLHRPNKGLASLLDQFKEGNLVPSIGKTYPLPELPAAMQAIGDGNAFGKLVIVP